jgi:hypothetical protein
LCPGASDASRKRRRESHGSHDGGAHKGAHKELGAHGGGAHKELTLAHKELTLREEKALVSDAQALLDDLESMLDGGAPSASAVKTAGDHVGGAWAPPSTRSSSAGDANLQSDDDELERLLDHESDDQEAVESSDNGDLDADDEEAVDEELDLY